MSINLFPHQRTAVDAMHNGCVLVGGVGTGKSLTSIAYYYEKVCEGIIGVYGSMDAPKDLYIITTAKKRDSLDWEADAIKFGLGKDPALNHQGVSITVDSWNNVAKYKEIKDAFFIFDESRIVGSGAWVKAFLAIAKQNRWVLLSATPGDTWLDYIPLFLANGFYKNRTAFKREHVVYSAYSKFPKVERYIATGKLVRLRNQITVQMPYERHTKRHLVDVEVSYDKDLYEKVVKNRWHVYEERPLKGSSELFSVMRRVVNSDSSRLNALREVMSKHSKVIVFYNFNYELETLRSMGAELMSQTAPSGSTTTGQTQTQATLRSEKPSVRCGMWTSDDGSGEMWIPCTPKMRVCGGETPWECHTTAPVTFTENLVWSASHCDVTPEKNLEGGLTTGSPKEFGSERSPSMTSAESEGLLTPQMLGETPWECETTRSTGGSTLGEMDNASGRSTTSEAGMSSALRNATESSTSSFAMAEWNGQKHEPIPSTDRWLYLVQYMAGAEGWNCTDTNAVVFYSQTYSYKQFEQAQGRIDRLNTPFVDLYYYNFLSKASIDGAIRRALKSKKSFNERDFEM